MRGAEREGEWAWRRPAWDAGDRHTRVGEHLAATRHIRSWRHHSRRHRGIQRGRRRRERWPIRNRDFLRVYVLRSFLPAPRPNEKGSKPCVNGNGWPQQNPYVTDDPHVD